MTHRRSRGIALLLLDHGTRSGWGVSVTPWPLFTSRKDPVLIVQEAGWAPGPFWTGAENLAPTGIRSLDLSTRSQWLYRLSYPANKLYADTGTWTSVFWQDLLLNFLHPEDGRHYATPGHRYLHIIIPHGLLYVPQKCDYYLYVPFEGLPAVTLAVTTVYHCCFC